MWRRATILPAAAAVLAGGLAACPSVSATPSGVPVAEAPVGDARRVGACPERSRGIPAAHTSPEPPAARGVRRPTAHLAAHSQAKRQQTTERQLVIRPDPDADWGASLADVEKVLRSAAETLWVHVPQRRLAPIHVQPKGGPIVLFDRGAGGAYRVRLNTGRTYWSQYAFQFAHEFCHILCRYETTEKANKWFEESVCETASLFALRRMAEVWKTDPPYPNWRAYAPHLRSYAGNRTKDARLPADTTLADWYARHADHLRKEACDRPKNLIVASALLPLLEEKPARWAAVQYLNAGARSEQRSFEEYLADWRRHCPARHRPFVRQVADLFGIRLPQN